MLALRGTLYQSWEWGDTRAYLGLHPHRVLLQNNGAPCAALQIFEQRVPALRTTLLYAAGGITGNDSDPGVVSAIAAWARTFTAEKSAILLRLETHFANSDETRKNLLASSGFRALPDQWSLWNLPRANMVVDIRAPEEELLKRMRKKHREHINRAQRSGLEIVASTEAEDLRAFYSLLLKSSDRQGFAVRDFSYFLCLREQLMLGNRGSLFLAYMDGKPVAGILCAHFGSTSHYLYGGFDWSARQAYANEALHWTAIQWAKKLGCIHYDMVGAGTPYPPVEGNQGYGLYNFKKGFGAELVYSAGYFDLVNRPILYRALRFAETHTGWMSAARAARSALQRVFQKSHPANEASQVRTAGTSAPVESTEAFNRR